MRRASRGRLVVPSSWEDVAGSGGSWKEFVGLSASIVAEDWVAGGLVPPKVVACVAGGGVATPLA